MIKNPIRILVFSFLLISLSSCSVINSVLHPATKTPISTMTPQETATPLPTLTPTPPPSVAIVNGLYVWKEDLETTLENLRQAYTETSRETISEEDLKQEALNKLIDETIFLSAAQEAGFTITSEELDTRIQSLNTQADSEEAVKSWQNQYHYSDGGLRRALEREIASAWMREKIFSESLSTVEQIHTYQILTTDSSEANDVKTKLDLGLPFLDLAKEYDPLTGGDMDWIPRGILVYPELEKALFALEPGTYTDVIETKIGFHILYAAEKSSNHELDSQTLQILQHKVLESWLQEQRTRAEITIL